MKNYPRLACLKTLAPILEKKEAGRAARPAGSKLAWVTSGAPVEILEALGFLTFYPENFAALAGARRSSVELCETAEQAGYGRDLCSYARAHIGACLRTGAAPAAGLPRPDALVCCTNICLTVLKWYEALARLYGCPLFVLDAPYPVDGAPAGHALAYFRAQLEDFIAWAEGLAGARMDPARLVEAVELSRQAVELWSDIRRLGAARPSPLNASDLFFAMAPMVQLRGSRDAVEFYRLMKAELEQRAAAGIAAVPEERFRLIWDNIAVWHQLPRLYRAFADAGACFVADSYTGAWAANAAADDPLDYLARVYAAPFIHLDAETRAGRLAVMAQEFGADGLVMHSNRSCKPFSLPQGFIRESFTRRTGLPVLVLEADMADPRSWNEAAVKLRMEAFLELLSDSAFPAEK